MNKAKVIKSAKDFVNTEKSKASNFMLEILIDNSKPYVNHWINEIALYHTTVVKLFESELSVRQLVDTKATK